MLKGSNVIGLQISTADIMQQIVWIGSSSIRTVRTFVPEPGIPGILGVRVTPCQRLSRPICNVQSVTPDDEGAVKSSRCSRLGTSGPWTPFRLFGFIPKHTVDF